jgi:hypothetical protein
MFLSVAVLARASRSGNIRVVGPSAFVSSLPRRFIFVHFIGVVDVDGHFELVVAVQHGLCLLVDFETEFWGRIEESECDTPVQLPKMRHQKRLASSLEYLELPEAEGRAACDEVAKLLLYTLVVVQQFVPHVGRHV